MDFTTALQFWRSPGGTLKPLCHLPRLHQLRPIALNVAQDGLLGLAAEVHLAAALPHNYVAFEYCGCKRDLPGGVTNDAGVPNVCWHFSLCGTQLPAAPTPMHA